MSKITRRQFNQVLGAGVGAGIGTLALPGRIQAAGRPISIGWVHPETGPLASLAEGDKFVLSELKGILNKGIEVGGVRHPIQIITKDSRSDPNRAAEAAAELILRDKVDLVLADSAPETTNPVADQCEQNHMPCLTTFAPWQPYFFGRGGDPKVGFKYTYHFFWGLEDITEAFCNLWDKVPTNRKVGAMWPNDGDGNAWSDPKIGWPPYLAKRNFELVDPGRVPAMSDDYSAAISLFKSKGVEIVTGVMLPPAFITFWTQAREQNFHPKIVSFGKSYLFPASIEAMGTIGYGLTGEMWWNPSFPYKSSLTGQTAREFATLYITKTGRQWTQALGSKHALFEVALDAIKRTGKIGDADALALALSQTKMSSLAGELDFTKGPVKNVARNPLMVGQWQKGDKFAFDYKLVGNDRYSWVKVEAPYQTITY